MVIYFLQKEGITMKKNSLTTLIILIVFVPVAVRFFWSLPIVAIILFVSVFRLVKSIMNQNQKKEENGQNADTETTHSYHQEKESTIITCEYCGSKVDTSKHAVCDHCGGPYWDDDEWKMFLNRRMY